MKTNQELIAARLLGLTLAVICLFAGVANAAPIYQGTFTLPNEVRWGKAMLPPGEYSLRVDVDYRGAMPIVTITAKSGKAVAFLLSPDREDSGKGDSALLISVSGNHKVVHSLRLTELGVTFIYDPDLAHGRGRIEEARKTSAVPVTMAKK